MIKLILIAIIAALIWSSPDVRLTLSEWLQYAADFLANSEPSIQ